MHLSSLSLAWISLESNLQDERRCSQAGVKGFILTPFIAHPTVILRVCGNGGLIHVVVVLLLERLLEWLIHG